MVKVKYLTKRHGSSFYYYVRNISPEHRHLFDGKKQIWKSLRTADERVAIREAMNLNAKFDARLIKSESNVFSFDDRAAGSKFFNGILPAAMDDVEMAEYLAGYDEVRIADDLAFDRKNLGSRKAVLEKLEDDLDRYQQSLASLREHDHGHVEEMERQMTRSSILGMRVLYEKAARKLAFLTGRPFGPVNDSLYEAASRPEPDIDIGCQMSVLADHYLANYTKTENQKTLSQKRARLGVLLDSVGRDTVIMDVTAEMIIEVRDDVLPHLPKRPSGLTAGMAAPERANIALKQNLPRISAKTQGLHLSEWNTFFKSVPVKKLIVHNPCEGLFVKGARLKRKVRTGFSADELNLIFSAPVFTGCEGHAQGGWSRLGSQVIKNERYWVPLVSLFSGMTTAEICELRTSDFEKVNQIDVMKVQPDADLGRTVKNPSRIRDVPIHPALVDLGFLEYVRQQPNGPIFPELHRSAENPSSAFGKWFHAFRNSIGVDRDEGPKVSFHSFRHTFREACRESDIPDYVAKRIGGWSAGDDQQSHYGTLDVLIMFEHLKKLHHRGLDLSHLLAG
ncbi:MAG: site-specific integrase [Hyphomonas sp.]